MKKLLILIAALGSLNAFANGPEFYINMSWEAREGLDQMQGHGEQWGTEEFKRNMTRDHCAAELWKNVAQIRRSPELASLVSNAAKISGATEVYLNVHYQHIASNMEDGAVEAEVVFVKRSFGFLTEDVAAIQLRSLQDYSASCGEMMITPDMISKSEKSWLETEAASLN